MTAAARRIEPRGVVVAHPRAELRAWLVLVDLAGISGVARLVAAVLWAHVDAAGRTWASVETVAREAGCSRASAFRALAALDAADLVRCVGWRGRSRVRALALPDAEGARVLEHSARARARLAVVRSVDPSPRARGDVSPAADLDGSTARRVRAVPPPVPVAALPELPAAWLVEDRARAVPPPVPLDALAACAEVLPASWAVCCDARPSLAGAPLRARSGPTVHASYRPPALYVVGGRGDPLRGRGGASVRGCDSSHGATPSDPLVNPNPADAHARELPLFAAIAARAIARIEASGPPSRAAPGCADSARPAAERHTGGAAPRPPRRSESWTR